MSIVKDFRDFILRGNVVDLAVGVVIGAAFTNVVAAFTKGFLTPLIGLPGNIDLSNFKVGFFLVGEFLNSVITFLLTALVIFFFVVRPVNWLMSRRKTETPVEEQTVACPQCLSKIPALASRCAFCTSEVTPAATSSV